MLEHLDEGGMDGRGGSSANSLVEGPIVGENGKARLMGECMEEEVVGFAQGVLPPSLPRPAAHGADGSLVVGDGGG